MWTCWKVMPAFKNIQRQLRAKYNFAIRVIGKNDGKTLMLYSKKSRKRQKENLKRRTRSPSNHLNSLLYRKGRLQNKKHITFKSRAQMLATRHRQNFKRSRNKRRRRLTSDDLIFFQKSPSFCNFSRRQGSLGTQGRQCDASTSGYGSCKYLCCGRGYRTVNEIKTKSCNCHFRFCCQVECQQCVSNQTSHYCL